MHHLRSIKFIELLSACPLSKHDSDLSQMISTFLPSHMGWLSHAERLHTHTDLNQNHKGKLTENWIPKHFRQYQIERETTNCMRTVLTVRILYVQCTLYMYRYTCIIYMYNLCKNYVQKTTDYSYRFRRYEPKYSTHQENHKI